VFFTLVNFAQRPYSNLVEKLEKPFVGVGNGVPWLTCIPAHPYYPWVFALATLVEQNVMGLVITALTLYYGGRYLERAWGSHEFTKFMLFVAMIPNILAFLLYTAGYFVTGHQPMLYVNFRSFLCPCN
jgi:membrane associated rhomboid family serine protease